MVKTRKLNLALAESLEHFVGKILVIGPRDDEEHSPLQFIDVPTSDKLAPLAIIAVRFGALYLAESKGLPIGTLRYIAQITRDEVAFSLFLVRASGLLQFA